jgi:hypothetical protein
MAYTTINKGSSYFNTKLYTGTGSSNSLTGVGFKPDWVWFKNRSTTNSHSLFDILRGVTKNLITNSTAAESTNAQGLTSFNSDGFTVGNDADVNGSSNDMVAWNWLASNTTVSNTAGTITSTVSANTTAGFSIVSYTGNGSAGATVGHGLGAVPKMIIIKNRDDTDSWEIYHASLGATKYMQFTTAAAATNINRWNDTAPTSSVFSLGTEAGVNQSTEDFIAYCFADVKGYSKFGSYTGNGNADGTFVYTGFKPAFFLGKNSNNGSENWFIFDNKRDPFNTAFRQLFPNTSGAEGTNAAQNIDIVSNGFKMRSVEGRFNESGSTIIYMAFAENPFVTSTQIPTTAR